MIPEYMMTREERYHYQIEMEERENSERIKDLSVDYSSIKEEIKKLNDEFDTLKTYISDVVYYPAVNIRDPKIEIKRDARQWAAVFTFGNRRAYIYATGVVKFINTKGNEKRVKFKTRGELKDAFIREYK
jgi:hypothetical protein